MKRKTINSPNYKECGIGFTTGPTCVMENPHQWGLNGNSLIIWCYLVSRINKEQFFNGRTIKTQLKGVMGETAIAKALKALCDLGFCTKRIYNNEQGQFAGWAYTFYAIPKERDRVRQIKPDVYEKLEAAGWFDSPDDGFPSSGSAPDDGSPHHGEPSSKGKDKKKGKDENKEKTPNPLLKKEGASQSFSGEGKTQPLTPETSASKSTPEVTGSSTGRHHRALSAHPVGSRLLKMLRPGQIPGDKALRPLSRLVEKGDITDAYLTYLWEKVLHPNQEAADKEAKPLSSVPEILEIIKSDAMSPDSSGFRRWKVDQMNFLNQQWKEGHENLPREEFQKRGEDRAAGGPFDGIDFIAGELIPDFHCTPFRLYVYWKRCGIAGPISYHEENLIEALHKGPIWEYLLDQAAGSHKQFLSLERLVKELKDKLPPNRPKDTEALRENYIALNLEKMNQLKAAFAEMGAKPPAIQSAE